MSELKQCSHCKSLKDISLFSKTKKKADGTYYRNSWCNSCRVKANREKKGMTPRPVSQIKSDAKECLHCKQLLPLEKFYAAKKGVLGVGSYCKDCFRKKYSDKSASRKRTAAYRKKHSERWRAMHRIHQFNRKALVNATDDGTVTDAVLKELLNKTQCCWCGKETPTQDRTIEHVIELSNGGLHSASNLDMACKSCNFSRPNRGNK